MKRLKEKVVRKLIDIGKKRRKLIAPILAAPAGSKKKKLFRE